MKLKLNVKYKEKEDAKKMGAKWDSQRKTWYIPLPEELTPFSKWLDSSMLINDKENDKNENRKENNTADKSQEQGIRLFMEVREGYPCCKCGKGMDILQPFEKKPKNIAHTKPYEYALTWDKPSSYVQFAKNVGVEMVFRSTSVVKTPYALHVCPHCGQIQGDFYIFQDKDCRLPVKRCFEVIYVPYKDEWKITKEDNGK